MTQDGQRQAGEVADAILSDFKGAYYYRDAKLLQDFLRKHYGPGATDESVTNAAGAVAQYLEEAQESASRSELEDLLRRKGLQ